MTTPVQSETGIELLLVDDSPDSRNSAALFFKKLGYRVQAVGSEGEAIAAVKSNSFNVAIVDMHVTENIGLSERLRTFDPNLQIIILTPFPVEPLNPTSEIGCFVKPVRLANLSRLIRKLVSKNDSIALTHRE